MLFCRSLGKLFKVGADNSHLTKIGYPKSPVPFRNKFPETFQQKVLAVF